MLEKVFLPAGNPYFYKVRKHLVNKPLHCPTCHYEFKGGYCYNCGEKSIDLNAHAIKKYVTDAIDAFTHFDGKFFITLKYLLAYPGKLTSEYLAGRRVKLMKPLQLYLIVALLYFLFLKSFDLFYNNLDYVIKQQDFFSLKAKELAIKKAAEKEKTLENFVHDFDYAAQDNAKAFVFMLIPALALFLFILFFKVHNKYVPHLIFATHYFTFYLVSWAIYTELVAKPLMGSNNGWFYDNREWLWAVIILLNLVYLVFALRHVYRNKWFFTILKAVIISQLIMYTGTAYKIFITQFTLWTI